MTLRLLCWALFFVGLGLTMRLLIGRRGAKPRRSVLATQRIPAPLERWGFMYEDTPDGSPWITPREPMPIVVTIVDVQNGWVRYHHGDSLGKEGGFNDHREKLDVFMSRFHPWPTT